MTAEAIANVVAEIRSGQAKRLTPPTEGISPKFDQMMQDYARSVANVSGPVVDMTAVYRPLAEHPRDIDLYGDHPCIAPPWPAATFAYHNEHGNVVVVTSLAVDYSNGDDTGEYKAWTTENLVDWERVRWVLDSFVWLGGRSGTNRFKTSGPWALWRYAIYENGEPADLHWMELCDYPIRHWGMANVVLLGALNFLSCRNVVLVEPRRPRAQARRIARTGVQVSTISVFPVGKSARTLKAEGGMGTPLTSVRGHFACYGPEYGRGLLFGKHAGRYWIPPHARGDSGHGQVEHDYVLRTEAS